MPNAAPPKTKYICWTWNNPAKNPQEALEALSSMPGFTFVVFQEELSESGTPHYQGYSEFSTQKRYSVFRTALGVQPHCELRRGSQEQAIQYCTKEDTYVAGPWRAGEPTPSGGRAGARSDLSTFRDAVRDGATKRQLMDDYPEVIAKYPHFAHSVRNTYYKGVWKKRRVILLYGDPGAGKTRFAHDDSSEGELWETPVGDKLMFDGVGPETTHALIDDFMGRGSKFALHNLLKLLDGRPLSLKVMYTFTTWHPDVVYLTTNYKPQDWYDWSTRMPSWGALKRRFSEVHIYQDGTVTHLKAGDLMTAQAWDNFWAEPQATPAYHTH